MKVTKKCWQINMLVGDRDMIHEPEVTQVIGIKFAMKDITIKLVKWTLYSHSTKLSPPCKESIEEKL